MGYGVTKCIYLCFNNVASLKDGHLLFILLIGEFNTLVPMKAQKWKHELNEHIPYNII